MDKKKKFYKLIELYINQSRKSEMEEYYGYGSRIIIDSINTSVTKNQCIIESTVVLGKEINEDYLEKEFADLLLRRAFKHFYPEFSVNTLVKWDV